MYFDFSSLDSQVESTGQQMFNIQLLENAGQQMFDIPSEQSWRINSPNINDPQFSVIPQGSYSEAPPDYLVNNQQPFNSYLFPNVLEPSYLQFSSSFQENPDLSAQSQFVSHPLFEQGQKISQQQPVLTQIQSSDKHQKQMYKGGKMSKQHKQKKMDEQSHPAQLQQATKKSIKKRVYKTKEKLMNQKNKACISKNFGKYFINRLRKFFGSSNQIELLLQIPSLRYFQESKSEALCQILNFPQGSIPRELAKFYLENRFYADLVNGQKKESPQEIIPKINSFLKSLEALEVDE